MFVQDQEKMLTKQRKKYLLEELNRAGRVIAKEMAAVLGLSEDTIRRDLRELARQGDLIRVHGGALPASPAVANFEARKSIASDSKISVARKSAQLIKPGQIVILDGGTTTAQLARHLPPDLKATIVTHSPSIAVELSSHPLIEIELIGGRIFKHSVVSMGTAALEALKHIRADIYFMGVTGIHPEMGLTTGDLEEAYMKKALSQHAAETLIMASEEKVGMVSPYLIMPASDISTIILSSTTHEDKISAFKNLGVDVVFAD